MTRPSRRGADEFDLGRHCEATAPIGARRLPTPTMKAVSDRPPAWRGGQLFAQLCCDLPPSGGLPTPNRSGWGLVWPVRCVEWHQLRASLTESSCQLSGHLCSARIPPPEVGIRTADQRSGDGRQRRHAADLRIDDLDGLRSRSNVNSDALHEYRP